MYNINTLFNLLQASAMDTTRKSANCTVSVLRQLAASFYDALLLLAILLIAAALTVPLTQAGMLKPNNPIMSLYYLAISFLYVAGSWIRGGKTLGMHIWHIRLEQQNGQLITWRQAFIRFCASLPAWGLFIFSLIRFAVPKQHQSSIFPDWLLAINPVWLLLLACIWIVFDHWQESWRDKLAGTRLVLNK